MRPRDSTGRFWSAIDCNHALQGLRAIVIGELCERDYARGIPRSGQCYVIEERDGVKTVHVDPDLSRRKHSGDETQRLTQLRWREFCEEPRDPAIELKKFGKESTPEPASTMHVTGLGETIESAIARGIAAGLAAVGQGVKPLGVTNDVSNESKWSKQVDKRTGERLPQATAGSSQGADAENTP